MTFNEIVEAIINGLDKAEGEVELRDANLVFTSKWKVTAYRMGSAKLIRLDLKKVD